jgi:nicotinate phosphoribosyltransferase
MIIQHLTDTDLYKLSQQQAVFHQYPSAKGTYQLSIRTKNPVIPLGSIAKEVEDEINSLSELRCQDDELKFIASMPWFKPDYIDFLKDFKLHPRKDVGICIKNTTPGGLDILIRGPWHQEILWEIYILAIVEEVYCRKAESHNRNGKPRTEEELETVALARLAEKVKLVKSHPNLKFTDFGTRRRFSRHIQREVLRYLRDNCPNLVGTSNVWFAKEFGMKAIGTMAHEFCMAHLALVDNIDQAQKRSLHVWLQEYGEDLGTALTDTFTTPAFWRDFDPVLARSFSGVRQDSGNPVQFGLEAIAHYKKLGIDPRTKSIIFSDALDFPKMVELFETFTGQIGVGFGIGTNLCNDIPGVEPLSIVIKLMELNGVPLVKLSDVPGKVMGDQKMVDRVRIAYGVA